MDISIGFLIVLIIANSAIACSLNKSYKNLKKQRHDRGLRAAIVLNKLAENSRVMLKYMRERAVQNDAARNDLSTITELVQFVVDEFYASWTEEEIATIEASIKSIGTNLLITH